MLAVLVLSAIQVEVSAHLAHRVAHGGVHRAAGLRGAASANSSDSWNPPSFYDAFASAESTWDYDAADKLRATDSNMHEYVDGYNPDVTNPFDPKEAEPKLFAESESMGPEQALQTYYPVPGRGPAGHNNNAGEWYRESEGQWIEAYDYPAMGVAAQHSDMAFEAGDLPNAIRTSGAKAAEWFDSSVNQYDNYGRPKEPYPGNPYLLLGYTQKAVNTSLSCTSAGCTAESQLNAFQDGEIGQNCRLSVYVKPTDFGDDSKQIEFITVNDQTVALNCTLAKGVCNTEQANVLTDLQACVSTVDVNHLMSNGSMIISAKISDAVNDSSCAYNGNLLYAVPEVTCMVGTLSNVSEAVNVSALEARPVGTPMKLSLGQDKARLRKRRPSEEKPSA